MHSDLDGDKYHQKLQKLLVIVMNMKIKLKIKKL